MTGIVADLTETETVIVATVIATCGVTVHAIHGAIGRAAISRSADPALSAARRLARTSRSGRIRDPVKTNLREESSLRGETNRPRPGAMKVSERGTSATATSAESAEDEVGAGADAAGATAANTLRTAAPKPPHPLLPATPMRVIANVARPRLRARHLHPRPHRCHRPQPRCPRRRALSHRRRSLRRPLLEQSKLPHRVRERKTSTWSGLPRRSRFRAEARTSAKRSAAA